MVLPSDIKCKIKRENFYHKQKADKNQEKLQRRLKQKEEERNNPDLKEERLKTNVPKTLENTREFDETVVEQDEEVFADEEVDEFASYFNGTPPNILVTTSRLPSTSVYGFAEEFVSIFPNAKFIKRGSHIDLKQLVEAAIKKDYTDLIVINEDRKKPNAITFIHLPDGPTAHFKLSSIKLSKEISGHGRTTPHTPELILNNFQTRLGHTVGRMFAALFPQVPEFKGRQAATFHNQRDFIFFRRHRYIFKNGERCDLQELGPRFTLKLKSLQNGTFDTKFGDYEFIYRSDMGANRRRFYI